MSTDTSLESLWGLNEEPRMPAKAAGWESMEGDLILHKPQRCDGSSPYASASMQVPDDKVFNGIWELVQTRADDFGEAARSITPEAWRLLFYREIYTVEASTAFRFHAETELRSRCAPDDGGDPPSAWLGSIRDIADITSELEMSLRRMGRDACSAAWLVLCLAQRANLTKSEILHCTWWDPAWIKAFTSRVKCAS